MTHRISIKTNEVFPSIRTILGARDALFRHRCYGPFLIIFPATRWADQGLDRPYVPSVYDPRHTVRSRFRAIDQITDVVQWENVRDHLCIVSQIGSAPEKVQYEIECAPINA